MLRFLEPQWRLLMYSLLHNTNFSLNFFTILMLALKLIEVFVALILLNFILQDFDLKNK
jgi:hypothetical protein